MSFHFGCFHRKTSFPMTLPKTARRVGTGAKTYIVCLDCGREFPYSWDEMKIVKRLSEAQHEAECGAAVPV